MTEDGAFTVELAIAELRRGIDVRLANQEGQIALLYQRNELHERRADDHARLIEELEARLSAAEREQVTRAHLDNRFRHTLALLSLIATMASVAVGILIAFLGR
ncbi:hypothetical protein [Actinomadura rudentiformis]|uniref:Uncharacterized protein n=1 Tax=Actinomadura rudentiformis TaxID=359158 RepID=A0A6H9YUG1_9ACTN|nr:hypothetical protein [Actinomadura rudentiformis]KAB2349436.1 hypothetical protein F8566_11625 [Actinomadura rudentiformis]